MALQRLTVAGNNIFKDLILAVYGKHVKASVRAAGLAVLGTMPHGTRHIGPPLAAFLGILPLDAIQKRGRWQVLASVRRYEKAGKLTRMSSNMDRDTVADWTKLLQSGGLKTLALEAAIGFAKRNAL